MKRQKGFIAFELFIALIFIIVVLLPWVWNGFKFASCDFESSYKCEIIHGAGIVIPPAALITVWFATDEEKTNENEHSDGTILVLCALAPGDGRWNLPDLSRHEYQGLQ